MRNITNDYYALTSAIVNGTASVWTATASAFNKTKISDYSYWNTYLTTNKTAVYAQLTVPQVKTIMGYVSLLEIGNGQEDIYSIYKND